MSQFGPQFAPQIIILVYSIATHSLVSGRAGPAWQCLVSGRVTADTDCERDWSLVSGPWRVAALGGLGIGLSD